ncbi:MAG: cadherin domain-containing protein, partial [Porticoccaceae bacterium]|nr:cadherin domain-containing protein [Porticoccaceae bacterium]
MKTTTEDSSQNEVQEGQAAVELEHNARQPGSEQLVNKDSSSELASLENQNSVEQLDLALPDNDSNQKPLDGKNEAKKRKEPKNKVEEEAVADEQIEPEAVAEDGSSVESVEELVNEAAEESLISEALADQDAAASSGVAGSGISMTTIALGTAGLIGAVAYFKKSEGDDAPTITSSDSGTVEENSGAGQVVYTAAVEGSVDVSSDVTFSLAAGSDAALSINAVTGEVTLSTDPDYETQSEYSFTVVATDTAGNASQVVTLSVTDLDDTAPVITSGDTVSVDENAGAEQVIYTATSDDSADVSEGVVSYALAADSDAELSIDAATGAVTLASDPNHEVQSEFNFTVIATDGAGNSAERPVTLSVNDIDEVAPVITSSAAVTINENSGEAQIVYTATADDSADISGGVSYSLSVDSDAALGIDAATGAVTLAADPDHEAQSEYSFTVVATDTAGNASQQAVTLSVVDLDDTAPTITSGNSASVVENSGAAQVVYTATSDDSADVSSGGISYTLSADSDPALSIDTVTGEVALSTDPDYETQSEYDFTVIATDAANNASGQAVTLSITNIDDTAPVVTSASTASVDENSAADQVIYTAVADDSADISGGVTYSLEDTTQYPPAEADNDAGPVVSDVSIPVLGDATNLQRVYVSSSVKSEDGTQETVVISYQSDDSTLTGLGLRIHFDSSALSLSGVSDLLAQDQIDADAAPSDDVDNLDGDAATDKYIDFAWASLFGNWPGSGSADLATLTFDIAADATGSSPFNFSVSSNAAGYTFEGQSHSVAISEEGESSNSQLSIDAATGEVTLSVSPDYEVLPAYSFNITATDAAGNVSDQQAVTVAVNNLDEVAPVVTSGDTAGAIDENSGAGQVVYTAVADDSGDISDGISYSLAAGSDAALTIDEATGEVSLTVDPDHEAQDQYSFTVVATDAAGNQSVGQAVTLSVTDLDDTAPTITSSATVSVDEQIGADQVVYTATSDDSADVASGDVVYSLSGSQIVNNPQPQLNADSQMVYVSQSTLSEDGKASVTVSYSADDSTVTGLGLRVHFDSQTLSLTDVVDALATDLIVNVADLSAEADSANFDNDASTDSYITLAWASLFGNWPGAALPQDLLTLEFDVASDATGATNIGFSSSSSAVGFTFDASAYALATEASGEPSDPALSIDAATGEVMLSTDPDYETQSEYSFTVVATDPAGNAGEQEVTLSVNNVDDVPPAIISSSNATVVEGSGAGQVIYTAVADDSGDISDGVTFGLLNNDNADLTIDATTGEVTLATDPDYETAPEFNFTLIATDAAGNASVKNVDVSVSNIDETDPTITSAAAVSVDENSGAGKVVYTATADDSGDISDGVTFSLAVGSDPSLSIDAVSGEVTLAANPDQEAQDQYSFTVVATDAAGYAVDQAVTLSITDLDDMAPTVTSGATANAIDENSGAAQVIYTATADDSADVSDGPITFSLSGDSDSGLSIDAASGAVTLSSNPDFETKSQYSFTVIATDAAGNASVGETVTLDINNIDDTAPVITSGDTATAIDENSGADQVVYAAVADDSADVSGGVNFSLAAGSDAALSIDANSGEVTLPTDPDYDVQSDYSFTVVATDTAGNASEQAVTLSVNNVDEVAPTFTSLTTASVIENTGAGQVVYVARAEDDGDVSDGVSFSLSGDSDAALTIDSETGQVTLVSNPQFAVQPEYVLTVIATDVAGNSTEQAVTLSVVDVDAENPVFVSDTTSAVDENIGVEQVIYTASANDQSVVSYSLSGDSDPALSIDAVSGAVALSSNPDHEVQGAYSFTVIATDTSGNSSQRAVTVAVDNLDELAPTITSVDTATAIDENSGVAQVVYTVTANDNVDDVTSEPLSYSLSDDSAGAFSIDANSGEVTLNANPDFEAQSEYSFTVVATDTAGNSSDQVIALSVNNLDEVAPSITSGDSASVVENSGAGQVVYTATSVDSADLSDGVSYSLSGDSDAALNIDASTGEVTLAADPDYQVQTSYAFTVIATDDAGNASQQVVTLAVTETVPLAPSISLVNDSGLFDSDGITSDGEIAVGDLKAGATWEYSVDGGASWTAGIGASFELTTPDSYSVAVRQSNTAGTSDHGQLNFVLDQSAPQVDSVEVDTTNQVIKVHYNETLGEATPSAADFSVKLGSTDLTVNGVSIDGSSVVLAVTETLAAGALQISYVPSTSGGAVVEDLVGNQVTDGFSQFVVSDGYIRGAQVYLDANKDGIADPDELLENVSSDEQGQILLEGDHANSQIIVKGGVNTDSGAANELELTAPAGYSVLNPFTTLVEEISSNSEAEITLEEAESTVLSALSITLAEGEELSSYDPLSDVSDNALDNRIVAVQIATVLAVASAASDEAETDSDAESVALSNLAEIVTASAESAEVLELTSDVVEQVLQDETGASLVEVEQLTALQGAVATMQEAEDIAEVVQAQADAIDRIAPNAPQTNVAPQSDLGISDSDNLTADTNPTVRISIDASSTEGAAAIVGDRVEVFNTGASVATFALSQDDIDRGYVDYDLSGLTAGNFFVSANITDIAGNTGYASSLVFVVDTTLPTFTSSDEALVAENVAESTLVYTASVSDDDLWKFELTDDSDSELSIDASTGEVSLAVSPDFEAKSAYNFTVVATDIAGNTNSQAVVLNITNLDDTAPQIDSPVSGDVDENIGQAQVIYTATSDDSADVSSGGITYSLSADSDHALSIDAVTGEVTLSTDPDYETQSEYSFAVVATDVAGNVSDGQEIRVAVNNLDEAPPTITSGDTAAAIDENSGAGQLIYTATSEDSADASSGAVTYSLAGDSDTALSVDATTGAVTLVSDPDQEAQDQYSFTVIATDPAGNTSQQAVTLSVTDVDDTAPTITSGDSALMNENSGAGQIIYTATSDDSADVSDGGITYSLAADSDAALTIDAATGEVTLVANPDQEAQDQYSFTVVATDAADNAGEQEVTLTVNDLDEVAPSITSGDTATTIDENTGAEQVIYTATSDDSADVSDGVSYSLAAGSDAALSINAETGEVILAADPDQETQDQYSFTVVAIDAAGNAGEQAVTLSVSDLDEIAPTFTSLATASVMENTGADQVVYVAFVDDSADISDGVSYSLSEDSDAVFNIDSVSGQVTLSINPVFADQPEYNFAVIATDAAGNDSQQAVVLSVVDIDQEAPVFTSANMASIDENVGGGQVIYTATSEDQTVVSYGLSAGSDAALSIDAVSGAVTLSSNPDYETQSQYSFTVIATDVVDNVSEQAVTLTVNNLDEIAPVITSSTTADVNENSGADQVVYIASSDDSGATYSLAADSDAALSIDENSGAVTLASDPDHEAQDQYNFTVVATDTAGNASQQAVTLAVNDLDEIAPVITSGDVAAIDENSGAAQVIYTATADDSGATYSLEDTTEYSAVDTVSDSGSDSDSIESVVSIPEVQANTQHVYVSESTKSADGAQETVVISYNASAPSTGLGLRIHYDSSVLTLADVTDVLTNSPIDADGTPAADTSDLDGDASTDTYVDFAWASLFGGWPGTGEHDLVTLTFD